MKYKEPRSIGQANIDERLCNTLGNEHGSYTVVATSVEYVRSVMAAARSTAERQPHRGEPSESERVAIYEAVLVSIIFRLIRPLNWNIKIR